MSFRSSVAIPSIFLIKKRLPQHCMLRTHGVRFIFLQRRIYLSPLTCAQRDGLGRIAVTGEASTSAARSGETDERGTRRALLSQLGSPDVLLLAGGLVLPNLLSFATLISLLDIGLPRVPARLCSTPVWRSWHAAFRLR